MLLIWRTIQELQHKNHQRKWVQVKRQHWLSKLKQQTLSHLKSHRLLSQLQRRLQLRQLLRQLIQFLRLQLDWLKSNWPLRLSFNMRLTSNQLLSKDTPKNKQSNTLNKKLLRLSRLVQPQLQHKLLPLNQLLMLLLFLKKLQLLTLEMPVQSLGQTRLLLDTREEIQLKQERLLRMKLLNKWLCNNRLTRLKSNKIPWRLNLNKSSPRMQ